MISTEDWGGGNRGGDPGSRKWKGIHHPQSLLNNKVTSPRHCQVSPAQNRWPQPLSHPSESWAETVLTLPPISQLPVLRGDLGPQERRDRGCWREPQPWLSGRDTEACNVELSTPVQGVGMRWEGHTKKPGPEKLEEGASDRSTRDRSVTCVWKGVLCRLYWTPPCSPHYPLQCLLPPCPSVGNVGS